MMLNRSNHCPKPTLCGLASLCLALLLGGGARRVHGSSEEFSLRLQEAVELTQREFDEEVTRIDGEQQVREKRLDETHVACEQLAGEMVDRRISVARKQQALAGLRRERETLLNDRVAWQKAVGEMKLICRDVHRELSKLAATLPASEHRERQQRELDELNVALEKDDIPAYIRLSLGLAESFLDEAHTAAVYEAQILDPQGVPTRARLLRVGLSRFAYRIPESSRVAVGVPAPLEETGPRWQEGLPKWMRQGILAAIDRKPAPKGLYWVPVDVSGTISAAGSFSGHPLWGRIRSGGVVMIPLGLVAAFLVILIAERLFVLSCESQRSVHFCEHVLDLCGRGEFDAADDLAGRTRGVLSRTLRVCMTHRYSPPAILDDAIQEAFLQEFPKLERFLPAIGLLCTVAPMLGLLGTVTGIIATFDVITIVGSGQPHLMAAGISEALVTTVAGLVIAIPGLLVHSVLSGKVNSIIADAECFAATLSNLIKQHQYGEEQSPDEHSDVHGTTD